MKRKSLNTSSQMEISSGRTVIQKINLLGWTCELKNTQGVKLWYGYKRFGQKVRGLYIGKDLSRAEEKIKKKEQQLRKNSQAG